MSAPAGSAVISSAATSAAAAPVPPTVARAGVRAGFASGQNAGSK